MTIVNLLGSPQRTAGWLIALVALLHLAAGARLDLSTDEAHYALFAVFLDWSYYDHPPLVGWLQALVLPFSDSALALRVMPAALFSGALAALYRLTRLLFPDRSPWLACGAVALAASAPMLQLLGLAMVPDTPLLLVGTLAVIALHRVTGDPASLRRWLWLGLLLGLAGLAKYTAVTLVVTVVAVLLLRGQWRVFGRPGPWVAALVALVLIAPVLVWNFMHDWASFRYQIDHGVKAQGWEVRRFALAQLAQFLLYNPAAWAAGLLAIVHGLRRQAAHPGVQLLLAAALPILLLFGWTGGYHTTLPHWTSLAWFLLSPLSARYLDEGWQASRRLRVLVAVPSAFCAGLVMLFYAEAVCHCSPFPRDRNPLYELRGWPEGTKRAIEIRERMRMRVAGDGAPQPQIFVPHWTLGSRVAWYARPEPVIVADNRPDQFDIWFGAPRPGARGVMLAWSGHEVPIRTGGPHAFQSCMLLEEMDYPAGQVRISQFRYYWCEGWRGD